MPFHKLIPNSNARSGVSNKLAINPRHVFAGPRIGFPSIKKYFSLSSGLSTQESAGIWRTRMGKPFAHIISKIYFKSRISGRVFAPL